MQVRNGLHELFRCLEDASDFLVCDADKARRSQKYCVNQIVAMNLRASEFVPRGIGRCVHWDLSVNSSSLISAAKV